MSESEVDISNCCITCFPAQVLSKPARPIEKIDDNTRRLVDKMTNIMIGHKGVGLAGPQAGVNLQIFIISLDTTRESVKVYINPVVKTSGDLEMVEEGCLSVPGVYVKIHRYKKSTVSATDLDGEEFSEEADGLYARVLQHENDHLQGVTIADRMGTVGRIANRKQLNRLKEKYTEVTKEQR